MLPTAADATGQEREPAGCGKNRGRTGMSGFCNHICRHHDADRYDKHVDGDDLRPPASKAFDVRRRCLGEGIRASLRRHQVGTMTM
jgi:hypothetical protein